MEKSAVQLEPTVRLEPTASNTDRWKAVGGCGVERNRASAVFTSQCRNLSGLQVHTRVQADSEKQEVALTILSKHISWTGLSGKNISLLVYRH